MKPLRIFISSVQKEFAEERMALRDYLLGDALLRRFFECFLFEEVPAADRRADEVYPYAQIGRPAGAADLPPPRKAGEGSSLSLHAGLLRGVPYAPGLERAPLS